MSETIDYTKIANLIQDSNFIFALKEIKQFDNSTNNSIQLTLLKLHCLIELQKLRPTRIEVNKAMKLFPNHYLLLSVDNYLLAKKKNLPIENPLIDFSSSFSKYVKSELPSKDQFQKLMNQILNKVY